MKSGVSIWDKKKLWDEAITIIIKFPADLKIEALQLCTEIREDCIVHDRVSNINLKIFFIVNI